MRIMNWRFFITTLALDLPLEEIVDEVRDFDERFGIILQKHVAVLGWWCILNFLAGIPGLALLDGWLWYFLLMNLVWSAINFAIALLMYNHVFYRRFKQGNVFQRFEVQRHVEKILLLNIGLEVGYFFAGLYLLTLGRLPDIAYPELWRGFGWAVLLQAVYMFIHDFSFHLLHVLNFRKCKPFLEEMMETQMEVRRQGA
ncbi:MAG: hypothetical protein KDD02_15355 [Phaeodactylibacter sp.]|nr:hypothetical protein [Phaeodactylibacter sp.]MCB9301110.1 hypothetical protein [Lewinellaceae bacterium]